MKDTSADFESVVEERYRRMSPDERFGVASSMYETACAIVLSSLPSGLAERERRLALAKRMYGDELPLAAMIAFAEWPARRQARS